MIWHSIDLQAAVAAGDVQLLCSALGEPPWHVAREVERLRAWLNLTFHLRNLLHQFQVLDFVSLRTLRRLPHLPPSELRQLDSWLSEDLAEHQRAAAAAAAAGGTAPQPSGPQPQQPVTEWARCCGCWAEAAAARWDAPPSSALLALLQAGRLRWEQPAAAASSGGGGGGSGGAAEGRYSWVHGPAEGAELCGAPGGDGDWAQARAERADLLQSARHPRNQGRLLLSSSPPGAAAGGAGCAAAGSAPPLAWGTVTWRFGELDHPASCFLQRHPVLGSHDRLIRVTLARGSLTGGGGGGGRRRGRSGVEREQEDEALALALRAVLTHGVLLAGRRYRRLVQKDIGQDNEALWLLATDSVAPEDAEAWRPINPAAARQLLGAFSSLPTVSKLSARGALLVSNAVQLKVPAARVFYIPDARGPTDARGNSAAPPPAAAPGGGAGGGGGGGGDGTAAAGFVMTDGAGFISEDLAALVPAVAAGEVLGAEVGCGVMWPRTPLQVRLFDPHFGGVVAKGLLLPLSTAVLPPGTVVLRSSQVKAPEGGQFEAKCAAHWQRALAWAHAVHRSAASGRGGAAAGSGGAPPGLAGGGASHEAGAPEVAEASAAAAAAAAAAAEAAHCSAATRRALECTHPQDRPWVQEIWFVHQAWVLAESLAHGSGADSGGSGPSSSLPPPTPMPCLQPGCSTQASPPQREGRGGGGCGSGAEDASRRWPGGGRCCGCCASLEVVNRPPDSAWRSGELRVNKNLVLLLHHAGVPQEVFEHWLKVEQFKLQGVDQSLHAALAAARAAGATDVAWKLEACMGLAPARGEAPSLGQAVALSPAGRVETVFRPDLALKQELHDIKVARRQRLANISLPVPTAAEEADAAAGGAVRPTGGAALPGRGGVRLLGLPDPSAGGVPEGCVAVRQELVPPDGLALIYRDPGVHPGDLRRVKVVGYPDRLLALLPQGFGGALFLPSVGRACLGASLAGGDYDGDHYMLLFDPRVLRHFRRSDPAPYGELLLPRPAASAAAAAAPAPAPAGAEAAAKAAEAPGGPGAAPRWAVPPRAGWEEVERLLTGYHSFCLGTSGLMAEAHCLWERYADRHGLGHPACEELAHCYYRALDAPKTGCEVSIPRHWVEEARTWGPLPPWHSRAVKETRRCGGSGRAARGGGGGGGGSPAAGRRQPSKLVSALWSQLRELPPLDSLDPQLLELDPDLVVQEGPDAVPVSLVAPLIDKWGRLASEWSQRWLLLMQEAPACPSKAEARALAEDKADLQLLLRAKFEGELWASGAAAAQGGQGPAVTVFSLPHVWLEASACYQAVYRRAQSKQQRLASLTEQERAQRNSRSGYEDSPRVAMAWRVCGQHLRALKVHRALVLRQVAALQRQQELGQRLAAAGAEAGTRALAGALGRPLQLGSAQHPLLASLLEEQHAGRAGRRDRAAPAAATAAGLSGLSLA